MTQNAATPHARLVVSRGLLLKAAHHHDGMYKHAGGYYLLNGRWHKLHKDKPAPKGAPIAAHPKSGGDHAAVAHFTQDQWDALKLPDTNTNAPSYNKALANLQQLSDAGNVTGMLAISYGSNTYGQKLAKIANHLLGLHGSKHQVAPGQKSGTHAALQSVPAEPHPSGLPEHLAPKTTAGLQEPGPLAPLAQHVMNTLDDKAAEGDVEFLSNVAKNNPEHPQIVAYAQKKLAELKAKAPAPAPAPTPSNAAAPTDVFYHGGADVPSHTLSDLTFFTTDKNVAQGYLDNGTQDGDGKVHAVHLAIKNAATDADVEAAAKVVGIWDPHENAHQYLTESVYGDQAHAVAKELKKKGFDGAKLTDMPMGGGDPIESWVAFSGSQVKEAKAPATAAPAATAGPLTMPDFEEGKQTAGVKDHYEKVAQKVIDHGHAGNGVVLEDMKADGLKPNAKGKVSNTWAGKTANSKKLLALHDAAVAHATGGGSDAEPGPKEGDTKSGADGQSLVFKNGRWHKYVDADESGELPPVLVPVADAPAVATKGDVFKLDSQYEKMNAGDWVVYNVSPDGQQVYMHKVGAKVPNQTNSATIPATTLADAVAKGTAKKQASQPKPESTPEPAPAAPPAVTPASGSLSAQQLQNLQSIPWFKLKLPAENTNAKSHNAALDKIHAMAFAGDKAGLQAFIDAKGAAKQTYAKKQVLTAQTALAALGTPGATAAVPVTPAPAPAQAAPPAPAAPKTVTAPKFILHNTTGGHNKSWSVYVAPNASGGADMVTEYGKIGGTQQKTVKSFPTVDAAQNAAGALKLEKLKKGYESKGTIFGHKVTVSAGAPETGPKEGDTKQGADGMLVLKDGHWVKVDQGPKALTPGDLENIKTKTSGYSKSEFAKVLIHAALAGDAAAIQKWKASNAGKMPITQKLADKLLAAMGAGQTATAGDMGGWQHSASDPSMSGVPTLSNDSGVIAWSVDDGQAEFHYLLDTNEPEPITAPSVSVLLAAMAESGFETPPLAAVQKLDPGLTASDMPTKAEAPAAPKAPIPSKHPSMDSWVQTGPQGGSNPGGRFKDADGVEWYCKFPPDENHAHSEVLAAKLYQAAGLGAQDAKLVTKNGKVGIASRWVEVKKVGAEGLKSAPGALSGFVVDAWLANWDVVGLGYDNLQAGADGRAVRVDAGGSLQYRAQGEAKPFGHKVTEIDTMRDPKKNAQSAAVFGALTAADMTASAKKVLAVSDDQIHDLVMAHGPGDVTKKAELIDALIARKEDIAKRFPKAVPKTKVKPKPDPTKLKVTADQLPKPHDFKNWKGAGQGLSSKDHVNEANQAAEQALLDTALQGNLIALKDYHYDALDKETGAVVGKKSISDHPSNHVKTYWSDLVSTLSFIAYPPEALKEFKAIVATSIAKVSDAFKAHKYGTATKHVEANSRLAFWIALGKTKPAESLLPPGASLEFQSSPTGQPKVTPQISQQAQSAYQALTSARPVKRFINGIQSSGSYNDNFRDGRMVTTDGWDAAAMALDAYSYATEKPEGFELYKWISFPGDMGKQMLAAPPGTVFQNPGSMCCSTGAVSTAGFGADRVRIRYAKGAKAVDSFGSGNYQGEKEITTLPGQRFVILKCHKVMCPVKKKERIELDVLMLPPDPTYVSELETLKGKHGGKS